MKVSPFLESIESTNKKSRSLKNNLYAKGDHIEITIDEMEWQTAVFKLSDVKDPEEAAFKALCRDKSLLYLAELNGYTVSDEELQDHIDDNVSSYDEAKKEGFTDPQYEAFGGAEKYETAIKEVSRRSMMINKYLSAQIKPLIEAQKKNAQIDDENTFWNEKQEEIESLAVESEHIKKLR